MFTAGIFKDILNHAKFSLRRVCLVIFDECHHSAKDDDYAHICGHLNEIKDPALRPKVLGLTASVVNGKLKPSRIEFEVAMLERRLNARLITSSSVAATTFGTSTKEILCFFVPAPADQWAAFNGELKEQLLSLQEKISAQSQKANEKRSLHDLDVCIAQIGSEAVMIEKCKRVVSDCLCTMEELGPWPVLCVAEASVRDLEESLGRVFDIGARDAVHRTLSVLHNFRRRLQTAGVTSPESRWLSNKAVRLVDLLKPYFADGECRGIVFVEQRAVTFALSNLLQQLAGHLGSLKPAFITGHGKGGGQAREMRMASGTQLATVSDFRAGKVNLLVATKVVEEGMDIQSCNLVIKFNCPSDYRSYVQSKGRARSENSAYIVFIARTEDNGMKEKFRLRVYEE